MIDLGKKNIIGVCIDAVDYEAAIEKIITAAHERRAMSISALAVHGTMIGALDPEHRYRLNSFGLVVPDGQPVRWALNLLHHTKLPSRVYGPELTIRLLARAEQERLAVYLFGSTQDTLALMREKLLCRFPQLGIAGAEPSSFRQLSENERDQLAVRIGASGARILFVGLGCPRQEIFAYEMQRRLAMPIMAVGAAFPFIAGILPQAPRWMQDRGLEWLFRLGSEPRRLWKRYFYLNPCYLGFIALQALGFKFSHEGVPPSRDLMYG